MKKFRLFYHKNVVASVGDFQSRVQKFLDEHGPATELQVSEGSGKHDMIVVLAYDDSNPEKSTQDVLVSGWIPSPNLEEHVAELSRTRTVRLLSVFSSSESSRRNVVIALTEKSSGGKEASQKQDANGDAGSGRASEAGSVSADRRVDEGRVVVDDSALHPEVRSDVRPKARSSKGRSRKRNPDGNLEGDPLVQQKQGEAEDVPESSDS
jgi:hypothetical protein